MEKIISITQHANRRQRPVSETAEATSNARGRTHNANHARPRGILLMFPEASQGPLYAAAIAMLAILATVAPAVRS